MRKLPKQLRTQFALGCHSTFRYF